MANSEDVRLSELVDGELETENCRQVIKAVKGDQRLEQKWTQYYLIREVIKSGLPDSIEHNLFDRVHDALKLEPPLVVPEHQLVTANVASKNGRKMFDWSRFFPANGFAIAASVFAVTTLSIVIFSSSSNNDFVPQNMISTATSTQSVASQTHSLNSADVNVLIPNHQVLNETVVHKHGQPPLTIIASSPRIFIDQPVTTEDNWARIQVVPRLNTYMVEHSELVSSTGAPRGVFPFTRVVNFGDDGVK